MSTGERQGGGMAGADPGVSTSRESLAGAGWRCKEVGVSSAGGPSFSWINPVPLWQSRNQYLNPFLGDPTDDERRRWMEMQREAGQLPRGLILDRHADLEEVSFIVVGDTGEGDASQHAVVRPLLACGQDTDFMVVCKVV